MIDAWVGGRLDKDPVYVSFRIGNDQRIGVDFDAGTLGPTDAGADAAEK